tara:strand:+ start:843 stop:1343 length:501 start_codon:yes stop_codon:yes gene_type:complete
MQAVLASAVAAWRAVETLTMDEDESLVLLGETKRVFAGMRNMRECGGKVPSETLDDWRAIVKRTNREIARLRTVCKLQEERHRVEMAVFSEEVRHELVDREASAARTADRFRVLYEKESGGARNMFDRAVASASAVDAALASLCPHTQNHTSKVLVERMSQHSLHP